MFFGKEPDVIKDSPVIRTVIVLAPTMLFIVLAYISEQRQLKNGSPKQDR